MGFVTKKVYSFSSLSMLLIFFSRGFLLYVLCVFVVYLFYHRGTEFAEFLFACFTSLSFYFLQVFSDVLRSCDFISPILYFLLVFDEPKGLWCFTFTAEAQSSQRFSLRSLRLCGVFILAQRRRVSLCGLYFTKCLFFIGVR